MLLPASVRPDTVAEPRGYVALLAVLVVGAVGVAVVTSVILLGIGSARTSASVERSGQAKGLANACVEEALQQIRDSTPFSGTATLTFGLGSCTYTVTNTGGANRTIDSSGTAATVVRKVKVLITQINPTITVASWQEVADL